jgi:hypothetical protein
MKALLLFVLMLVATSPIHSKTILVPEDYPIIQWAIDKATFGDVILVAPGLHYGNPRIDTVSITLRSDVDRDPATHDICPEGTTIRATQKFSTVTIENAEVVVEGFTITKGQGFWGGGVMCGANSYPILLNNIITGNTASISGGGISCHTCWPVIVNNIIYDNQADSEGGGIDGSSAGAVITNNIIFDNSAALGGGIGGYFTNGTKILNNTIHGNQALQEGGGLCLKTVSKLLVKNTIVWGNEAPVHPEISPKSSYVEYLHCNVQGGWPGTGNIGGDPLFVDAASGDFHVTYGSPCIDAGQGTAMEIHPTDFEGDSRLADGNGDNLSPVDIGADEFLPLKPDTYSVSEASGALVNLTLDAGAANAHRHYLLLGSMTGVHPGQPLPGGLRELPLIFDDLTAAVMLYLNTPLFSAFLATLDASGRSTAQLNTGGPMPPGSAGHTMYFAYALNNPFDFASNPVSIGIKGTDN